jgi:uncharacterized protein YsxB (DUF464 family)
MITVTFRSRDGGCVGFSAEGHAGYGPPGQDIVCAAVSSLVQSAVLALNILAPDHLSADAGTSGHMEVRIRDPDEMMQVVMAVMELSLEDLQRQYPENVRVCHE